MRAPICCRLLVLSMLFFLDSQFCHGQPVNNGTSRIVSKFADDREYDGLQVPLSSDKKLVRMIDRRRLLNEPDHLEGFEGRRSNVETDCSPESSHSFDTSSSYARSPSYENIDRSKTSIEDIPVPNESSLPLERALADRQGDVNEKLNTLMSIDEASLTQLEENNVHARVKRNVRSSLDSRKTNAKKRSSKSQSKTPVSSETPKDDSDNEESDEVSEDSERNDYVAEDEAKAIEGKDETERQSNVQDVDSFVEQDERSNSYDDFEAKDVAKRGVENAEDYEELQDNLSAPLEDAEFDRAEVAEEIERSYGDVRVKRDSQKKSESEAKVITLTGKRQTPGEDPKGEISEAKKDDSQSVVQGVNVQSPSVQEQNAKVVEGNSADAKVSEEKLGVSSNRNDGNNEGLVEASNRLEAAKVDERETKSNFASNEKNPSSAESSKSDDVKRESHIEEQKSASDSSNKNVEGLKESAEQKSALISASKSLAQAESEINGQIEDDNLEANNQMNARSERDVTNDQKPAELNEQQKPPALSSNSNDPSRISSNQSTNRADNELAANERSALQAANVNKNKNDKLIQDRTPNSISNRARPSRSESELADESNAEYEKRVEEQIQRKIDSIKEEIKREIEENQRIREIEANNARFDELQSREDDEDRQGVSSGRDIGQNQSLSKRSADETGRSANKRSTKRKRGFGEDGVQRRLSEIESVERLDPAVYQRSRLKRGSVKKRSATKVDDRTATMKRLATKKKRDYARQVFLVNDGRGKRRGRRRSRSPILIPEQAHVKVEDELPADFVLGAELREPVADLKNSLSSSSSSGKGLSEIEQSFSPNGKSDTLASLTGSSQELSPRLATEYKEAFGGLQDKPDGALARFKRIKRVLRTSNPKS